MPATEGNLSTRDISRTASSPLRCNTSHIVCQCISMHEHTCYMLSVNVSACTNVHVTCCLSMCQHAQTYRHSMTGAQALHASLTEGAAQGNSCSMLLLVLSLMDKVTLAAQTPSHWQSVPRNRDSCRRWQCHTSLSSSLRDRNS